MRFLADENFPGDAIAAIRRLGHDIRWVRQDSPGISDTLVLHQAHSENRVLLTFDKDFGELVFGSRKSNPPGVILFRLAPVLPSFLVEKIVSVLSSREDWAGHFSVIERDKMRMTPITHE